VTHTCTCTYITWHNVPDFGRTSLRLNYIDISKNTYILSLTVTDIMAKEV